MNIFGFARDLMVKYVFVLFPFSVPKKVKTEQNKNISVDPDLALKFSSRDVMIGVLRNREQLDIALKYNFYHVPMKVADEKGFPVNYIAIYQSKTLFGNKAGITYWGKIDHVRPIYRCDIKEIPSDSKEIYYYAEIEKWNKLEKPIKPKEIGFICERTSLYQLLNCEELPELLINSADEYMLYKTIKYFSEKGSGKNSFYMNGYYFRIMKRHIAVYKDEKVLFVDSIENFANFPYEFLLRLRKE